MAAGRIVRVLLVEDDESDVQLVRDALAKVPDTDYALHAVARFADAQEAVQRSAFDIILLALELPDSPVITTLRRLGTFPLAVPMIVADDQARRRDDDARRPGRRRRLLRQERAERCLARASHPQRHRTASHPCRLADQ